MREIIVTLLFALVATCGYAQSTVTKRSVHYATHDNQELIMDIYTMPMAEDAEPRAAMIFAFGGGFVGGQRDHEYYDVYFDRLAREGIVVVSIDYRLGLRNLKRDMGIAEMIAAMQRAVDIATEDMYAATNYLIAHCEELGVDTTKIMLSGSSAGAIAAVQAEWQRCNRAPIADVLPDDFRYAGVVACAGAIFSTKGKPKFIERPAPMLLFHGTSDSNVPYNKASIMGIGFYGSKYIAKQLDRVDGAYMFCSAAYVDHSLAVTPLISGCDIIMQFIRDYVYDGHKLRTSVVVESINGDKRPTRFGPMDYLKTNYAHR